MQTLVVAVIVALALLYIGRKAWMTVAKARRAKSAAGCADGCCK